MARPRNTSPSPPRPHKGQMRLWWNGRWWTLGPVGDRAKWQAEQARLLALWAVDPNAVPRHSSDLLLAELCADYLVSADAPRAGLQRERCVLAVDLLLELHPETTVDEFGPVMLRAWQTWLCGLTNAAGRLRFAVTTVNYHVDCIRRIWRWGVATERVSEDRANALSTVPRPKVGEARAPRIVEPADLEHVNKTLPYLLPPVRAMVVLQLATGARPGELCRMRAGEVHRGGKLHLPGAGVQNLDALGVWAYVPPKHKLTWKGKPRYLVFAKEEQTVLAPFLDRAADAHCFSPREAVDGLRTSQRAARLARNGRGSQKAPKADGQRRPRTYYTPGAYRNAIRKACVRAGVPHWFPYQLRHLAAAEVKSLYGLDAVKALLGHHTMSMAEHYGGSAFKAAAEVAKKRLSG